MNSTGQSKGPLASGGADTAASAIALAESRRMPSRDLFDRAEFVASIGEAILEAPGARSFITALNGPWGTAKTFTLGELEKGLEVKEKTLPKTTRHVTVELNRWQPVAEHFDAIAADFEALAAKGKSETIRPLLVGPEAERERMTEQLRTGRR